MLRVSQTTRRRFLQGAVAAGAIGGLGRRLAWSAEGDLIVRTAEPYNAEPRLLALVADRLTPVKHFYVRNHGELPQIDASTYKLRIEGLVSEPRELSLEDIKRLPQVTMEATLTCAGNRRQELSAIKQVGGVAWDAGAIGNAQWTGVRLWDVLSQAGLMRRGAEHIWFEGHDAVKEKDGSVAPFGGSIPVTKGLIGPPRLVNRSGPAFVSKIFASAILAYSMNGEPLTAEHGAPLRVIVPGYIGARSVKWLSKITVSDRPSPNHYLAHAYKLIQTEDKAEIEKAEPIYEFAVNAAICSPAAGATVKSGKTLVSGYALPSGEAGATIDTVEVSADGGQNWTRARLHDDKQPFVWQQWVAELDLKPGKHELVVRAADTRQHDMPEQGRWNAKGYMYNGWHRVKIEAA